MVAWISNELDLRNEALVMEAAPMSYDELALGYAHGGDIEPLRSLYPHIAEFIHLLQKGQRGKYLRRPDGVMPWIDVAVGDAKFVKLLWREVYGNRRGGDLSAEKVVADYYRAMSHPEVTEDAILDRAKNFRVGAEQTAWDAARARARAISIKG
jgi:hypothetical protein